MSKIKPTPYILVPETSLLSPLPEHHRTRFEKALLLMHHSLDQRLAWEEIAKQSAISPFHFHRQFSKLFNETPGQYLNRIRLQYALYLLHTQLDAKITDIALEAGFCSSQAMAKALKNELGYTAKQIRKMAKTATAEETSLLLEKLSHPSKSGTLEQKLAQSIPCELKWLPERSMLKLDVPSYDWNILFEQYGKRSTHLLCTTPISELEKPFGEMRYYVGDWACESKQHNYVIPAGYYLCCEVYLKTDTAFMAAVDALFDRAGELGYQLDEKRDFIESVSDIEWTLTGGAIFSFQVPVKKGD